MTHWSKWFSDAMGSAHPSSAHGRCPTASSSPSTSSGCVGPHTREQRTGAMSACASRTEPISPCALARAPSAECNCPARQSPGAAALVQDSGEVGRSGSTAASLAVGPSFKPGLQDGSISRHLSTASRYRARKRSRWFSNSWICFFCSASNVSMIFRESIKSLVTNWLANIASMQK
jgi:hypothetical protein